MQQPVVDDLDNDIRIIHERDTSASRFYLYVAARQGWEKEYRRDRGGLHKGEHLLLRRKTLRDTLRWYHDAEEKKIQANGNTSANFCYLQLYGPTRTADDLFRLGYEQLSQVASESEYSRERNPLLQELQFNQFDIVRVLTQDALMKKFYGDSAYGATTADDIHNFPRLSYDRVLRLRQRVFRSSNLSLVTIGRLPADKVLALAEETFGQMKRARPLKLHEKEYPRKKVLLAHKVLGLPTGYVHHAIRCGAPTDESTAHLYLFTTALVDSSSSLFFRKMRTIRGRTYDAFLSNVVRRPENLLQIGYPCSADDLATSVAKVWKLCGRMAEHNLKGYDFERYQRLAVEQYLHEMHDEEQRAQWYIQADAINEGSSRLQISTQQFARTMRSITPGGLRQAVASWIGEHWEGTGTVVLQPHGSIDDLASPIKNPHNLYKWS
jgi:predicted Zn-dependent peptidase